MAKVRQIALAAFILCLFQLSTGDISAFDLKSKVHEFQLRNGMKWLVVQKRGAPVFSGVVMLKVGGSDEAAGKTGLAHVFEHMAFKGSARLGTSDYEKEKAILAEIESLGQRREEMKAAGARGKEIDEITRQISALEKKADGFRVKNEIWDVMLRNGARDMNAYTAKDMTAFFASMPSNRLRLFASVLAEMVFEPSFREFYIERDVIADERRLYTDNNPNGELAEQILSAAYKDGPYHWSTIGFMDDITRLTIADAREFHRQHYVPSNMTGVIVGDVSASEVKKAMEETFGRYPASKPAEPPRSAGTPLEGLTKAFTSDAEPSLVIAYHKPTLPDKSEYAFDVITDLLCEGSSSRLKKKFVYEKRMIQDIECSDSYPGSRLDNLFLLWIEPMKGYSMEAVAEAVTEEIDELAKEPVSEEELMRVRKQVTSSLMLGIDDNMSLAQALAKFQTIFGDWTLLADYPRRVSEMGPGDVMSIAKRYLSRDERIVVMRRKGKK
jgi:predicted Zn-dependent peptidase